MAPTEPGRSAPRSSRWRTIGIECALWLRTLASAAVYATLIVTFGGQGARWPIADARSFDPQETGSDR